MKKLVLDALEIESFVTTPEPEARLGTVYGQSVDDGGWTEGASCNFTCAQTCSPFTCVDTCRFTC